jgi:TetR/AcrR family transcriptional regulator, fatty acid metabolism regulator protein
MMGYQLEKIVANQTNTSRKEQAEETRNRIYSCAIELMEQKGFGNFTIEDISKKAGVSVGAFYHYFDSKNDILAEIFYRADEYFSTQVVNSLSKPSIPEQIVEYFDHYAKFNVASGVETTKQLFNPKIKFFIEEGRPMLEILEDLIRKGQEKKEIRGDTQAKELVRYLIVMARGIVFEWSLYDGNYDLEAKMHKYMENLVSTIKA